MIFHYDSRNGFNEVPLESHVGLGSGIDVASEFLEEFELVDPNNPEVIGNNFIHVIHETSKIR